MDKEAMKKAIINSLNGKLKDGIKANEIAEKILESEEDGIFKAKVKISEESAKNTLKEIVTQYEIESITEREASQILKKIMFGKLTFEGGYLKYTLGRPIERGNGSEITFKLQEPIQQTFDENDIDLISILSATDRDDLSTVPKDLMGKCACIFMDIPVDLSKQLTVNDILTIFTIGTQLFLAK